MKNRSSLHEYGSHTDPQLRWRIAEGWHNSRWEETKIQFLAGKYYKKIANYLDFWRKIGLLSMKSGHTLTLSWVVGLLKADTHLDERWDQDLPQFLARRRQKIPNCHDFWWKIGLLSMKTELTLTPLRWRIAEGWHNSRWERKPRFSILLENARKLKLTMIFDVK